MKKRIKRRKSWRETYIDILSNGPDETQYALAAELINDGYAKGAIVRDMDTPDAPVEYVAWQGPRTKGREYLDDLQTRVRRDSWKFRLVSGLFLVATWVIGFLSNVFIQLINC